MSPSWEQKKMADKLSADDVLEAVSQWSLLEVSDFVKKFEEKFDVSATAAPVAVMAGAGAGPAEAAAVQTEFTVMLTAIGDQKIKVIKEVRALVPELGLKEAKGLVEAAPKEVLTDVDKETAEKAKQQLEAAGASAEIK